MFTDNIVDFPFQKQKKLTIIEEENGMKVKEVKKKSCRFHIQY